MAEPKRESDPERFVRVTTGPRQRSIRNCVQRACLLLRAMWWKANWIDGDHVRIADPMFGDFAVRRNDISFQDQNSELSLYANFEDEDFGYTFGNLRFLNSRRLKKVCLICAKQCAKLDEARETIKRALGREPTNDELCRALGLPPDSFDCRNLYLLSDHHNDIYY